MSTSTTAENHLEVRWITADGTFDPTYERTTAALRRWVDGMEQALLASTATRGAARPPAPSAVRPRAPSAALAASR
jgi:hypothetical protein